jgi:hypothetical protein
MNRQLLAFAIVLIAAAVCADETPNLRPKPPEPVSPAKLEEAIRKGVDHLVTTQNKDGSWGSPSLKGGVAIYADIGSHHAFGVAVTAMAISALIETGGDRADVRRAIERGEANLFAELPKVRRDTPILIYNVWTHAYGIQALVRMHGRLPNDAERQTRIKDLIRDQYEKLARFESAEGGWGYYDFNVGSQRPTSSSTSFVNAAVLVAMHEGNKLGVRPPEKVLKRAIHATQIQRQPNGTYLYGTYLKDRPTHEINLPGGSLGRTQACNLALYCWGDDKVTHGDFTEWLDRLITRNGWLSLGRKRPIPHESYFAVAGYFFYFGHYYAALTIQQLPAGERPFYQDHLAKLLMDLQEDDGSWWDYPFYSFHKPYGTSFALMSLAACRK